MTFTQILKVLNTERECITRQGTAKCKRKEYPITGCRRCDLCLPDSEILAVYDYLIENYGNIQKEHPDL